jgi:hypothetical protein
MAVAAVLRGLHQAVQMISVCSQDTAVHTPKSGRRVLTKNFKRSIERILVKLTDPSQC